MVLILAVSCPVILGTTRHTFFASAAPSSPQVMTPDHTITDRLKEYGEKARARFQPAFRKTGVHYPPSRLTLVGIKADRVLQVYAADGTNAARFICTYPILAASGQLGPKLREGDRQVPEGIYQIESLNPNSHYHLALRIGYPNAFDRAQAAKEGRTQLGGDIMIHGSAVSTGCLAVGDLAAEDLFVLAADTGLSAISVILTPVDFRRGTLPKGTAVPPWTAPLYVEVKAKLSELPSP